MYQRLTQDFILCCWWNRDYISCTIWPGL